MSTSQIAASSSAQAAVVLAKGVGSDDLAAVYDVLTGPLGTSTILLRWAYLLSIPISLDPGPVAPAQEYVVHSRELRFYHLNGGIRAFQRMVTGFGANARRDGTAFRSWPPSRRELLVEVTS